MKKQSKEERAGDGCARQQVYELRGERVCGGVEGVVYDDDVVVGE